MANGRRTLSDIPGACKCKKCGADLVTGESGNWYDAHKKAHRYVCKECANLVRLELNRKKREQKAGGVQMSIGEGEPGTKTVAKVEAAEGTAIVAPKAAPVAAPKATPTPAAVDDPVAKAMLRIAVELHGICEEIADHKKKVGGLTASVDSLFALLTNMGGPAMELGDMFGDLQSDVHVLATVNYMGMLLQAKSMGEEIPEDVITEIDEALASVGQDDGDGGDDSASGDSEPAGADAGAGADADANADPDPDPDDNVADFGARLRKTAKAHGAVASKLPDPDAELEAELQRSRGEDGDDDGSAG